MTSKIEYLILCANTINTVYSGDYIGLRPLISAIELLEEMAENDEHRRLLKKFIMIKLQGRALDCIPPNPESIEVIKTALETNIEPENSEVVKGRMLALKADRWSFTNFSEYAEKVETLGESLKRSLIFEGIPARKANEITIDRTIRLCSSYTTFTSVKSVLASSKFEDHKKVVDKFIIESGAEIP